jgi:hypothetical protein
MSLCTIQRPIELRDVNISDIKVFFQGLDTQSEEPMHLRILLPDKVF